MIHFSTGGETVLPDCISVGQNEEVMSVWALSGAKLPIKIHRRSLPLEPACSPCNINPVYHPYFFQFISIALVFLY